jgi:aromatic ring-opening dioxygenase catalytic subunit (LigB family)
MKGISLFLPHGGGPMPLLGDANHKELINLLPKLKTWIPKETKAVLVLSAHWESTPTLNIKNSLLYDYYGFPEESYQVDFDAILGLDYHSLVEKEFEKVGIKIKLEERGWDHGVFVPLKLMNLKVPLMQLSIPTSQDPLELLEFGKILANLLEKGISIIGSGLSFHNLPLWFSGKDISKPNRLFEQKLDSVMKLDLHTRISELQNWRNWEGSLECQPIGQAEHFSPLVICAAMGNLIKSDRVTIMNASCGVYAFQ